MIWKSLIIVCLFCSQSFSQERICEGGTCRIVQATVNVVRASGAAIQRIANAPLQSSQLYSGSYGSSGSSAYSSGHGSSGSSGYSTGAGSSGNSYAPRYLYHDGKFYKLYR